MNFGWGDVGEGAVCTTKDTLHSKHPLKQSVSFSSRRYSIYSFAQPSCPSTALGERSLDAGSWIPTFFVSFSFLQFSFQKPADANFANFECQDQLFLLFYIHVSLKKFLVNSSKNELWMGRCGGRGSVHHKRHATFQASFETISLF